MTSATAAHVRTTARHTPFHLDVAAKAALALLLLHAVIRPDLPQYVDKGMGYRLVFYPLAAMIVPIVWFLRGRRRGPYPAAVGMLLTMPFLIDTAGNAANLYDRVAWWDDAMHIATWIPLVMAIGTLWAPYRDRLSLFVMTFGTGAVLHILWEIAEYLTFVNTNATEAVTAYRDTIGDLAGSLLGSLIGALAVVSIARRHESSAASHV